MDSSSSHPQSKNQNRDYRCPCGKTYLSNAAIFTHIRQKHGGIPPGQIQKPVKPSKPRGRPPLNTRNKNSKGSQSQQAQQLAKNNASYQQFSKIFQMLNLQLPYGEPIPPHIWQTIDTFQKFDQFIDSRTSGNMKPFTGEGVSVGTGLSQFLQSVSKQSKQHQFSEILILFILLLQYCMDETNNEQFIENSSVQEMAFYMNDFITLHIVDYAQLLGLHELWATKPDNITKIFNCFIEWLKWKNYTNKLIIWLVY